MTDGRPPGEPDRYERGLDDYHDPTGGFAGAPPAQSALTLRLWLAGFGFVFFAVIAVIAVMAEITWLIVISVILAVVALADMAWIIYRKRRGEPG